MTHSPQQWLQAILQVRTGTLTATAAAQQLGVSRKTYYEWEARALSGMLAALTPSQPGRPERDLEAERVAAQTESLRQKCADLEQRLHIRDVMAGTDTRAKKKSGSNERADNPPVPT